MGELESLTGSEKINGMIPDHVASAHTEHGDFFVRASTNHAFTTMKFAHRRAYRPHCICQALGSTTRGVMLLPMMDLDDFSVKIAT